MTVRVIKIRHIAAGSVAVPVEHIADQRPAFVRRMRDNEALRLRRIGVDHVLADVLADDMRAALLAHPRAS